MAEKTKIQWCHHTFNPWIGCAKVNEGCKNCYAETLMDTRYGRVQWGEDGTRSRTKTWRDPLKWNRQAEAAGERRKVFCASLADVFEDRAELLPWREELFNLIDDCPALDFLLLTKRPEKIGGLGMWPRDQMLRENVWLGTSIANQRNADEYVDRLYRWRNWSPVLFLSIEPQIGPVTLARYLGHSPPMVDWVIVGGESRQGSGEARPFNIEWARRLVSECREAQVPCFVKQFGSEVEGRVGLPLVDSHGGDWNEWPADLHVRECPETFYPELAMA